MPYLKGRMVSEEICLAARRTLEQFKTGRDAVPSLPSLPKVGRYRGEVSLFDAVDGSSRRKLRRNYRVVDVPTKRQAILRIWLKDADTDSQSLDSLSCQQEWSSSYHNMMGWFHWHALGPAGAGSASFGATERRCWLHCSGLKSWRHWSGSQQLWFASTSAGVGEVEIFKSICFVCFMGFMGRHGPVLFVQFCSMQALADQDDWTKLTTAHVMSWDLPYVQRSSHICRYKAFYCTVRGSLNEKVPPSKCI